MRQCSSDSFLSCFVSLQNRQRSPPPLVPPPALSLTASSTTSRRLPAQAVYLPPKGTDGLPIQAKNDYGFTTKAVVSRPIDLDVKQPLAATTLNALTTVPSDFKLTSKSKDGRKWTFCCHNKQCKECNAKIRVCRPNPGQGDAYLVLQTKGHHHANCALHDKATQGEITFCRSDTCHVLP